MYSCSFFTDFRSSDILSVFFENPFRNSRKLEKNKVL